MAAYEGLFSWKNKLLRISLAYGLNPSGCESHLRLAFIRFLGYLVGSSRKRDAQQGIPTLKVGKCA